MIRSQYKEWYQVHVNKAGNKRRLEVFVGACPRTLGGIVYRFPGDEPKPYRNRDLQFPDLCYILSNKVCLRSVLSK